MRKARSKGVYSLQTLESIIANTEEVGECQEWKGYFCNGTPAVSHDGKMVTVRRLILALEGEPLPPTDFAVPKCRNERCVCRAHIVREHQKDRVRRLASRAATNVLRNITLSETRRRLHAKLTIDQVREIRASDDSYAVLAKRFGVSKSMVGNIVRGRYWKEHSSPFAGLMR